MYKDTKKKIGCVEELLSWYRTKHLQECIIPGTGDGDDGGGGGGVAGVCRAGEGLVPQVD